FVQSPLANSVVDRVTPQERAPANSFVGRERHLQAILEVLHQDPDYAKFLEQMTAGTGHKPPDNPKRIPIAIWSRPRLTAVKSGVRLADPSASRGAPAWSNTPIISRSSFSAAFPPRQPSWPTRHIGTGKPLTMTKMSSTAWFPRVAKRRM